MGEWDDGQHGHRVRPAAPLRLGRRRPRPPGRDLAVHPDPDGDGTRLEQWFQMGPARSGLSVAIDAMPDKEAKIVFVRLRELETAMQRNLAADQRRAERAG